MDTYSQILSFITLLAPLASFATVCLVRKRSVKTISSLSVFWIFVSVISAFMLLDRMWDHTPVVAALNWFSIGNLSFEADLAINNSSLLMLSVVSFISLLVHIYSIGYMAGDEDWKRYFAMLGFFTFSMQGIVLSDNLLLLFIFWELVGFSSYLLIGHWTKNASAGSAASKAFIINRIGDAAFLVGLMILWSVHETFSITEILTSTEKPLWQTAASLCIFCGVIGKSAQFPLFTWLPDAMEGPTPVSALIHAATMVAAGVYLLVRVFDLFTEEALVVVAITGMITTLIGALSALFQHDIKKILAYSTVSQLGLMILALGMGAVDAALLHLLTHAFFKACLFLSAGMVIHAVHDAQPPHLHFDEQDIRNLGGLRKQMPATFIAFLISGASLAGIPFFSGFISKEAIFTELFMQASTPLSWFVLVVAVSVSFLTVIYTFRLVWFVFLGEQRTVRTLAIIEPGWTMRLPVIVLAMCSLWFVTSRNPFHHNGWTLPAGEPSEYSLWITLFSILWVVGALIFSWHLFSNDVVKSNAVFRNGFYVDKAYQVFFGNAIRITNHAVTSVERKAIDRSLHALAYAQVIFAHLVGWIDRVLVDGTVNATARLTGFGGKITRSFQGGNVQLYIFWSVFATIIFIIWALK